MKIKIILAFFAAFFIILELASAGNVYMFEGYISDNTVSIYPPYYLGEHPEDVEAYASNYSLGFYDSNSVLLKQYKFPAGKSLYDYESNTKYFIFYLDFPENTDKIIFNQNTEIIGEFSISRNAPVINWVDLRCNGNSCHASWDANDSDGDFLIYDVAYYDGDWEYLAFDLGVNYLAFDVQNVSKIRIRASDGFKFSELESGQGRVINSCKIINEPGYYVLGNDILQGNSRACIDIQAENVHINCNNHLISTSSVAGIISGKSGTIIENCRINLGKALIGRRQAIVLGKAANSEIRNNYLENNDYGIMVVGAFNATIKNNILQSNNNGIEMRANINSSVLNNIINYTTNTALFVQYGSGNLVSGNYVYRGDFAGIYTYLSSGNKITGNAVSKSRYGFYLRTGENNEVSNNKACNNIKDVYCSSFTGYGILNTMNKVVPCQNFGISYNSC